MVKSAEELSEEDKRALRGSKFAPLPSLPPSSRPQPRLAHPGGPLKTNKAAALAKFLERKLQQNPNGLSSIDPDLLQLAVQDAKATVFASGTSSSSRNVHHVDSFDDPEVFEVKEKNKQKKMKKQKQKQKQKQKKKHNNKRMVDS